MKNNNKKRILVLNYEFPPLGGGASPVSYELAKGYAKLGNEVSVVTMGYKDLPNFEVKDGINIYRVKCLRSKKEICHPWEQLTYIISAKRFLKKHLQKNKYDICHCHFIIPVGVVALWAKKRFGLEYVITAHGSDVLGYNPRFKKLYPFLIGSWRKILDEAKKITTPSNFLKKEILKVYKSFDKDKIEVISNGIEEGKFKPMKKEKYILLVSRLFVNKGIQDFIEAIKDLDLKEWKVKIVGDGPYRDILEDMVVDYGLSDRVKFLGWVDNESEEMKNLYGRARVFVLPSHFENMNMTLIEAMQAGCAIIASDVGGNKEVIGDSGALYKVNDIIGLAESIKKMINQDDILFLRNGVRDRIKEKYNWDVVINNYVNLLK
ncbi:glycosyltransferase family 4 protein [Candidatus Parcubacteria bacterium]|nr:glycosyltransferase family 4 protein [Candidatus Parcubacteria bacterium]